MAATNASRYHRQMLLPGIGEHGQRALGRAHILIVGCGALGCAAADQLARAGVGRLTIIDRDIVEQTNLQRQCLFDEADAAEGVPKAVAAAHRLARINSSVRIDAVVADLSWRNALSVMDDAELIVDGTDNFETRYLLNDIAAKLGRPYCYGGVIGTRGMAATLIPSKTACLRCMFPESPPPGSQPTCDTAGVLAPAVQIVASCQVADAIKIIVGEVDLVSPTLLEFDLWSNMRRRLALPNPDPMCPCCALHRYEHLEGQHADAPAALCGRDAVQIGASTRAACDLAAIAARLSPHGSFQITPHLVRGELAHERGDSGSPLHMTVFQDGRAIIKGTTDPVRARSIYARYIGT